MIALVFDRAYRQIRAHLVNETAAVLVLYGNKALLMPRELKDNLVADLLKKHPEYTEGGVRVLDSASPYWNTELRKLQHAGANNTSFSFVGVPQ